MFDNIGAKIKGLAKFICWAGIVFCIVVGIILIANSTSGSGRYRYTDSAMIASGIVVIVVGSLLSWVGSFVLFGFGELVEKSAIIAENTKPSKEDISTMVKEESKPTSSEKYWVCPNCKKQNPLTSSICICGAERPNNRRVDWTCKYCGKTNKYYSEYCENCYRKNDEL